jgi:hypothetical protein
MASLECSNIECRKMLGYDCNNNVLVVASSELDKESEMEIKVDIRCVRCKRHNYIIFK